MNRWFGGAAESKEQAVSREQRAASRNQRQVQETVKSLNLALSSESEDDYRDCDLSRSFLNVDGNDDVSSASSSRPNTPVIMAKFEDENAVDDDDYYKKISALKNRMFNKNQPEFWFTSIETSLKHAGVKSQWSKRAFTSP